MKALVLSLLLGFGLCNIYSQSEMKIDYVDKSFDNQKKAFVKNSLLLDNDSILFVETRYNSELTDSISNTMLHVPVNQESKIKLIELINDKEKKGVFSSEYKELVFDKNQDLFTRRFRITMNNTDYYLYDIPNYNSSNRKEFELIMHAIEACMMP